MANPVFKLAGVVKSKNEPEDFEGPLALILQLLGKNKIEIQDISISLILGQYLEYLNAMAEMDLDIASEFVAMASHLAYIKTKMLLSGGEEVSELDSLISSLEELRRRDVYAQVQSVLPALAPMYFNGAGLIAKPPEVLPGVQGPDYSHACADLLRAIANINERGAIKLRSISKRPMVFPKRIAYPVDEKVDEVIGILRRCGVMRAMALILNSRSRSEAVATFVALLELCKTGRLFLAGDGAEMTVNLIEAV
ncbi:MAG: segregation/condensation protein A [Oscillospiraceae bacterium]|jgi:segregation and condensation protein A|nr:segregation/condensation protein A [Oscillospiraceae bacterium]